MQRIDLKKDHKEEIHPARAHFFSLHSKPASAELSKFLDLFRKPKALTEALIIEGVQHFIRIANLTPAERLNFYGSQYNGLYYNNDLAKTWNDSSSDKSDKIEAYKLNYTCVSDWDYRESKESAALIYRGNTPSRALDELLKGPTVIDCGMYCQLSLWFGIRYVLGDEQFDALS